MRKGLKRLVITTLAVLCVCSVLFFGLGTEGNAWRQNEGSALKTDGEQNLANENLKRIKYLTTMCSNIPSNRPDNFGEILYSVHKFNFTYCTIRKVASSAMGIALRLLASENYSLSSLRLTGSIVPSIYSLKRFLTTYDNLHENPSKVMIIVRNPFEKLFSGYMDRIYTRSEVVVDPTTSQCQEVFGFEQFLRELLEYYHSGPNSLNRHFAPSTWQCAPCSLNISYIVKLENIQEELSFVWKNIGVKENRLKVLEEVFGDKHTDLFAYNRAFKKMEFFYNFKRQRRCVEDLEMAQRVWTQLQSEGYIKEAIDFPYHVFNGTFPITSINLNNVAKETIKRHPMTNEEKRRQKVKVVQRAFFSVDEQVIRDIKEMFFSDFILFRYSYSLDELSL